MEYRMQPEERETHEVFCYQCKKCLLDEDDNPEICEVYAKHKPVYCPLHSNITPEFLYIGGSEIDVV